MSSTADPELVQALQRFLRDYYHEDIGDLIQKYPSEQRSLWIDWEDVYRFDPNLADDLVEHPETTHDYFVDALHNYDANAGMDLSEATVRFHNLDEPLQVDELRKDDVDRLRPIGGQVSKTSAIRPKVKVAGFECVRCGTMNHVPQPDTGTSDPGDCRGCDRQGPFQFQFAESEVQNHQLLRLKQPPEETAGGQGQHIDVHLEGDIVGHVDAGERANVAGILRTDIGEFNTPTLDFFQEASGIDRVGDDYAELDIESNKDQVETLAAGDEGNPFELLAASIAPSLKGGDELEEIETPNGDTHTKIWWIKLGLGLGNLFGGWRRPNGDGTYQRGTTHNVLIGDPSTGKSTLLQAIESISPRSASTSGKGASAAGLTAAAVKDDFGDTQWSLEAGALVKAHKGVACIDEIDKIQPGAVSSMHSALEKQRLEFNKAGIDATLKCETSLLAAGNPKHSRFDNYEKDHGQIDLVSSLLDRFDLVFTLRDTPDEERDVRIARHVIDSRTTAGKLARGDLDPDEANTAEPDVEKPVLQSWVAHARKTCFPVIEDPAVKDRLVEYYNDIRSENDDVEDGPVPATVRNLDGLLRLSEAAARVRLSDTVEMRDVEIAISVSEVSLQDIGYDPETGRLDSDLASGNMSHSQRDRKARVKGMIQTLEGDETGAAIDDVIENAVAAGIDEGKAEHEIEKLKQKGELYEPTTGFLRPT